MVVLTAPALGHWEPNTQIVPKTAVSGPEPGGADRKTQVAATGTDALHSGAPELETFGGTFEIGGSKI